MTTPAFEASRLLQTPVSADNVPFRKQLKDEARQRKHVARGTASNESASDDAKLAAWELTVGLEIHAQLNTKRKLFSGTSLGLDASLYYLS